MASRHNTRTTRLATSATPYSAVDAKTGNTPALEAATSGGQAAKNDAKWRKIDDDPSASASPSPAPAPSGAPNVSKM